MCRRRTVSAAAARVVRGPACETLPSSVTATDDPLLHLLTTDAAYSGNLLRLEALRGGSTAFNFIMGIAGATELFRVNGVGSVRPCRRGSDLPSVAGLTSIVAVAVPDVHWQRHRHVGHVVGYAARQRHCNRHRRPHRRRGRDDHDGRTERDGRRCHNPLNVSTRCALCPPRALFSGVCGAVWLSLGRTLTTLLCCRDATSALTVSATSGTFAANVLTISASRSKCTCVRGSARS